MTARESRSGSSLSARTAPAIVALAGNPNSGKTTLFNTLTGMRARTGNYPGITVDRRSGRWRIHEMEPVELIDVPGTYSLSARSREEQVAIETILPREGHGPDAVLLVADATTLGRQLYLALEILATGLPAAIALNMVDEADTLGLNIDHQGLGRDLGIPILPIVAKHGIGTDALAAAVRTTLEQETAPRHPETLDPSIETYVEDLETHLRAEDEHLSDAMLRSRALWALLCLGDDELDGIPETWRKHVKRIRAEAAEAQIDLDRAIISARYARIDKYIETHVSQKSEQRTTRAWTARLDRWLTHPLSGLLCFAVVMYLLFESLFTWSGPFIDLIDGGIGATQGFILEHMSDGALRSLLVEGIIGGVGNVVVFVPQIALLFLFITFLEDSGYLARVAYLIDRMMRGVGLNGKTFVPLLSGFACAIPAVMATRTIENRRDRLITMMAVPLMSCSARLPVYTLVIAVVFPSESRVWGVFSLGAIVLLGMYTLSVIATLGAAAIMRRTVLRGPLPSLVLELPPYRWPSWRNIAVQVWIRVKSFLKDAGTVILAISIVLWAMLNYPYDDATETRFAQARVEAEQTLEDDVLEQRLAAIQHREDQTRLEQSLAGQIGHAMEPLIEPLGFDWRIGIGLLGSFAAREVLVSTLGIVWGTGAEVDESDEGLRDRLMSSTRSDGTLLFTPLMGLSLMVFFVLAAQCMSTVAVIRRESGTWRWPLFMVTYMTLLAYAGSFLVFQVGQWMGFS